MVSSQFVLGVLVSIVWLGGSFSVPLKEKEFFWYPTDEGTIVPAFLKSGLRPSGNAAPTAIEDDVIFWHYLIGESEGRVMTPDCDQCLSSFIPGAETIFFAHGFGSDHEGRFGTRYRSGLGNRSDIPVNMIFIDWSKLAAAPWYEYAAESVQPVGEYTARLINFLISQGVLSLGNVTFVGHSLGAHMPNYISSNLRDGKIPRIFATDPALPLFGQKEDNERIDPTDGNFVNVIHTAMGTLLDGGLSFTEPRGHVDFYPNSGAPSQPGCGLVEDAFGACSHRRSYFYLAESISRPTAFPACKCTDWEEYNSGSCTCEDQTIMGWNTPQTAQGSYYLRTNANEPFGQGE